MSGLIESTILLKDLKYDIANSKKRAIGPKASKRIYHYLCNEN